MSDDEYERHERAWRAARGVGIVLLAAWPAIVAAAVVSLGALSVAVTVPAGPALVLGVMELVERALRPSAPARLEPAISAGS
jgi:hypothetical protein